ncbi:unnamed protein product [Caenorhabditis auriculariae]|uniref:Uncharacterized protein n=1 Tax=Caenorhabditis auriculariae TaxID=2777116 RepID=A0A8S1HD36_9PELO|nr:unnamed protein product [Caenorhabditis auriculariae]
MMHPTIQQILRVCKKAVFIDRPSYQKEKLARGRGKQGYTETRTLSFFHALSLTRPRTHVVSSDRVCVEIAELLLPPFLLVLNTKFGQWKPFRDANFDGIFSLDCILRQKRVSESATGIPKMNASFFSPPSLEDVAALLHSLV